MTEQQQNQVPEVEPIEVSETEMESMDNSENSGSNATEEQLKKYNELENRSFGNVKPSSDDFLTWLLILLGVIEPEDLGNDGKVKQETLERINDDENKKKKIERNYKDYIGGEAPKDITNITKEDKIRMGEEVRKIDSKLTFDLNKIATKIARSKLNGDIEKQEKYEERLRTILLPKNPDQYEDYVKAIQVKVNDPSINIEDAKKKVKSYKQNEPKKPVFYKFRKAFSFDLGKVHFHPERWTKRGRQYDKYKTDQRIKEENKKAKELMKKGTHGTAEEVQKSVLDIIQNLEKNKKINNKEAKTLRKLNIEASLRYKVALENYKKENGGKEPNSVEQTKMYERSFALAVNSREEEKGSKFSFAKKGAIFKLITNVKLLNKKHEIGCRRFAEGCDISSRINAKNIIRDTENKKMDKMVEEGVSLEEQERISNKNKEIKKLKISELENKAREDIERSEEIIDSRSDYSKIRKYFEKKSALRNINKQLKKYKKRLSNKSKNKLTSKEKNFAHRRDKKRMNDGIKKEALKANRVVGGVKYFNRFTAMSSLKGLLNSDKSKKEDEEYKSHITAYNEKQNNEQRKNNVIKM